MSSRLYCGSRHQAETTGLALRPTVLPHSLMGSYVGLHHVHEPWEGSFGIRQFLSPFLSTTAGLSGLNGRK